MACSYLRSPFLRPGNPSYGPIRPWHWVLWTRNAHDPRLATLAGPHLVPVELPFGAKASRDIYLGCSGARAVYFRSSMPCCGADPLYCCHFDVAKQGRRRRGGWVGHKRDRDSLLHRSWRAWLQENASL